MQLGAPKDKKRKEILDQESSKLETEWGGGSEIEKNPTFTFVRQKALNENPSWWLTKEYKTKVLELESCEAIRKTKIVFKCHYYYSKWWLWPSTESLKESLHGPYIRGICQGAGTLVLNSSPWLPEWPQRGKFQAFIAVIEKNQDSGRVKTNPGSSKEQEGD